MAELSDEQIDVVLQSQPRGYIIDPVWFRAAARAILALSATRAEDAELRKKAARYDWLRQRSWFDSTLCVVQNPAHAVKLGASCPFGTMLDDAVDAAMQSNGAAGGCEVSHG